MRTTLTLDPDVGAEVERRRRERGTSLKQEVNELLRVGLRASDRPASQPHRTPVFDVGEILVPIDSVHDALAIAEGEDYK